MITVIDVIRAMGLQPTKPETWKIGDAVRALYESEVGSLPVKVLRPKTNEPGSHCFAAYPDEWRPRIEAIVRSYRVEADRQLSLI